MVCDRQQEYQRMLFLSSLVPLKTFQKSFPSETNHSWVTTMFINADLLKCPLPFSCTFHTRNDVSQLLHITNVLHLFRDVLNAYNSSFIHFQSLFQWVSKDAVDTLARVESDKVGNPNKGTLSNSERVHCNGWDNHNSADREYNSPTQHKTLEIGPEA